MFKQLIEDFCTDLESNLAHNLVGQGRHVVFLISEQKGDYFIPDIPLIQPARSAKMLYAEIFIGQTCMFREFDEVDGDIELMCRRLLFNIFSAGMADSYKVVINRPKQ